MLTAEGIELELAGEEGATGLAAAAGFAEEVATTMRWSSGEDDGVMA